MLDTSNPDVMGPLMFFIFVAGTFITLGAMDYDFKKNKKNHSAVWINFKPILLSVLL